MPSFAKFFRRDGATKGKKQADLDAAAAPPKPKWEEAWARTEVQPEEIQLLVHVCTQEMKSKGTLREILLQFHLSFEPGGC
jgi:hypothetical protein